MQLIKAGEINVIDDGYNSNPVGAKNALKVLNLFDGRKIVVTPGLVELGAIEESTNFELGTMLVGFDAVILVGETQLGTQARRCTPSVRPKVLSLRFFLHRPNKA